MTKTIEKPPELVILELEPETLTAHPKNPRGPIKADDVDELRASIAVLGQKQACLVRPTQPGQHELVLGHRRAFACGLLKRKVRCVVEDLTDEQALAVIVADHQTREEPDPFLESEVVAALLERPGWNVLAAAEILGKPVRWVALRARLRKLVPAIRRLAEDKKSPVSRWPIAMLAELAALEPEAQEQLLPEIRYLQDRRDLDEVLRETLHALKKAPWDLEDAALVPTAGACSTCPKTSLRAPGLFDAGDLDPATDVKKARCLDHVCWAKKAKTLTERRIAEVRAENPQAILVRGDDDMGGHAVEADVAEGDNVLPHWKVDPAKKGEKGAIPALIVSGEKAGTVTHVKPRHGSLEPREKKALSKTKSEKEPTPAERLKASRTTIELRRKAFVVDAVRDAIAKKKEAPPFQVVTGLVAANEVAGPKDVWAASPARRKKLLQGANTGKEFAAEVWPRLKPAITVSLGRFGGSIESTEFAQKHELATWLTNLLDVDLEAVEAKAIAEIPDPKWWASATKKDDPKREKKKVAAASSAERQW